jgi:hypothetical protein
MTLAFREVVRPLSVLKVERIFKIPRRDLGFLGHFFDQSFPCWISIAPARAVPAPKMKTVEFLNIRFASSHKLWLSAQLEKRDNPGASQRFGRSSANHQNHVP